VKIALVIFRADPARGGAERYTADIAAALAARGHAVSLISTQFGQPIPGVEFINLAKRAATRLGRYARFLDALDEHLNHNKYDVVHAMLPVRRCDIYHPHAGLAKEMLAGRWMNQFNGIRRRFAAVEEELLTGPRPPVVLCLSNYVKTAVVRTYPGIESHLQKLFNAVDLQRFNPAQSPQSRDLVRKRFGIDREAVVGLMIAQDFKRKGLPQAIAAMGKPLSQFAAILKLLVVGKENPAPYAHEARRLGIADQIVFAGATDSPADFYRAADFFILPTRHDPCSLVVLEALAMGLPVISTRFNGACEIMENGIHGFVLKEPDDVADISRAIEVMLDSSRRQSMGSACLELRHELSFEAHMSRLESIYQFKR
jgi:UDP-glucose:(heptosyl)LPS alpha-1,3-glucosyltransferase